MTQKYSLIELDALKGSERAFFILMGEMNLCIHTLSDVEKERKDNLKFSDFGNSIKRFKEKIDEFKCSEKSQLVIISIKKRRFYKWLKHVSRSFRESEVN